MVCPQAVQVQVGGTRLGIMKTVQDEGAPLAVIRVRDGNDRLERLRVGDSFSITDGTCRVENIVPSTRQKPGSVMIRLEPRTAA